jgi:hypothetical protein
MNPNIKQSLRTFVADIASIPLPNKSIDIVVTNHALEPNHGRERELLTEMFRVSRSKCILFEPSWENNSKQGQDRMERYGYIRNLPGHIASLGARLISTRQVDISDTGLNSTWCYEIEVPEDPNLSVELPEYICPVTGSRLERLDGYWWSEEGGYVYPIIDDVPLLRKSNAIIMCHR